MLQWGYRMCDNLDKQTVDWHSGFYAAAKFEFRDEPFEFIREFPLNQMPIYIDVLIKKQQGYVSNNELSRIFRRVNVIEYKNPEDKLTYVQFFKTLSYASLYIGNAVEKNVLPSDVTISIFRDIYPKALIDYLNANGYRVDRVSPGIYYVTGNIPFPAQIVVTSQLGKMEHLALKVLTNRLNYEEAVKFISIAKAQKSEADKNNVDAVLQVSVNVNRQLYDDIKRRDPKMCEALKELMKDELMEARTEGINVGTTRDLLTVVLSISGVQRDSETIPTNFITIKFSIRNVNKYTKKKCY